MGIEGEENSKYFHASINRIRRQMSVKGIMKDSAWEMNHVIVKEEFKRNFQD